MQNGLELLACRRSLMHALQRTRSVLPPQQPLGITLILSLLLVMPLVSCSKKEERTEAPPPDVVVADVIEQDVPVYGEWVAQLKYRAICSSRTM